MSPDLTKQHPRTLPVGTWVCNVRHGRQWPGLGKTAAKGFTLVDDGDDMKQHVPFEVGQVFHVQSIDGHDVYRVVAVRPESEDFNELATLQLVEHTAQWREGWRRYHTNNLVVEPFDSWFAALARNWTMKVEWRWQLRPDVSLKV
jgi:hypothetical protein